jgi:hypothetical protein
MVEIIPIRPVTLFCRHLLIGINNNVCLYQ